MAKRFIYNACTILAIEELIEDQDWQPREIAEHVQQNQGMLNSSFVLIAQHAPVLSHNESEVDAYDDGSLHISSENGEYELEAEEKLVVTYETGPGRGHSACIQASEFEQYAEKHEIRHLFTR